MPRMWLYRRRPTPGGGEIHWSIQPRGYLGAYLERFHWENKPHLFRIEEDGHVRTFHRHWEVLNGVEALIERLETIKDSVDLRLRVIPREGRRVQLYWEGFLDLTPEELLIYQRAHTAMGLAEHVTDALPIWKGLFEEFKAEQRQRGLR